MASRGPELPNAEAPVLIRKRKSSGLEAKSDASTEVSSQETNKKVKVDNDCAERKSVAVPIPVDRSALPPEIWHRIFTFCPPRSLGNLLSVNKLFNLYLDPSSKVSKDAPASSSSGAVAQIKANSIWQVSRRLFWPYMPSPLRSKTELEMWRLACSHRCHYCGKLDPRKQTTMLDPHLRGPGENGVATIWPFETCMCAACLLKHTIKVRSFRASSLGELSV